MIGGADLSLLLEEIHTCRVCAGSLRHEPRPIVQAGTAARVLIIGQAPGSKVHASGLPWDDDSGGRLREWTGLARATFYDAGQVADALRVLLSRQRKWRRPAAAP